MLFRKIKWSACLEFLSNSYRTFLLWKTNNLLSNHVRNLRTVFSQMWGFYFGKSSFLWHGSWRRWEEIKYIFFMNLIPKLHELFLYSFGQRTWSFGVSLRKFWKLEARLVQLVVKLRETRRDVEPVPFLERKENGFLFHLTSHITCLLMDIFIFVFAIVIRGNITTTTTTTTTKLGRGILSTVSSPLI